MKPVMAKPITHRKVKKVKMTEGKLYKAENVVLKIGDQKITGYACDPYVEYSCDCPKCEIIRELEKYRLEKGIPQEKLASMLDVAFSTVNRWFNGKSKPSHLHMFRIRKLLEAK